MHMLMLYFLFNCIVNSSLGIHIVYLSVSELIQWHWGNHTIDPNPLKINPLKDMDKVIDIMIWLNIAQFDCHV